jgi:integrase
MPLPADTPLPRTRILDALTWDEALALYEAFGHAAGLAGTTLAGRAQILAQLRKWVQVEPARVTLAQLLAMQARPVAASTKQRNRSMYQGFFRWLFEEGYALDDPSKRLPKVRVPRATPRPVSVAQLEAVLERCRNRSTRTMILLGAYQGMRVAEIARIRGEMFDLEAKQLI